MRTFDRCHDFFRRALPALAALGVFAVGVPALAQEPADAILGVWATDDNNAHVEVYKKDGLYYGKFVWFSEDADTDGFDTENPDPELRGQPLVGADFILRFEFDGNKWKNGRIYNPENGKEYKADLELDGEVLRVRGWLGIRLLGRTVEWSRVR